MGKLENLFHRLFDRSHTGTWFALLMVFVATRSIIQVWTDSDQGDKYIVIALTGLITATYGLLRFVEFIAEPGFRIKYAVRSMNVFLMALILLGEYILSDMLGRMLVLLSLVAIEINLVSIYAEYTGRLKWLRSLILWKRGC